MIPYFRNSNFFHCEPTLQLLIFCTTIQGEQKVPIEAKKISKIHATEPPLRSVECKCRGKLVLEIKLHRDIFDFFACEGQSPLVIFWNFLVKHRPVHCSCPCDIFEDEVLMDHFRRIFAPAAQPSTQRKVQSIQL